jgi:hypothetical protein
MVQVTVDALHTGTREPDAGATYSVTVTVGKAAGSRLLAYTSTCSDPRTAALANGAAGGGKPEDDGSFRVVGKRLDPDIGIANDGAPKIF